MKKNILLALVLILVIGGAIALFSKNSQGNNGIILYYGDGCPHCANVDKFLEENKISEKVNFARKEVFNNKQNSTELAKKAVSCGLPTDKGIPIPFLWDGSKCITGDVDIIDFFKQKTGIK